MNRFSRCEVCGMLLYTAKGHCTNSRCHLCHSRHCTDGGITYPGHGRGSISTPFSFTELQAEAFHFTTNGLSFNIKELEDIARDIRSLDAIALRRQISSHKDL